MKINLSLIPLLVHQMFTGAVVERQPTKQHKVDSVMFNRYGVAYHVPRSQQVRSRYSPHQSNRECARRVRQGLNKTPEVKFFRQG